MTETETAILPDTAPAAPPEPPPQPALLVESLASLDRDYTGEAQFARLAVSSLRAFAARHASDLAVADAYSDAIRTLELLPGVLATAQDRQAGEVTRKVLTSEADRLAAEQAAASRDQALTWAAVGTGD